MQVLILAYSEYRYICPIFSIWHIDYVERASRITNEHFNGRTGSDNNHISTTRIYRGIRKFFLTLVLGLMYTNWYWNGEDEKTSIFIILCYTGNVWHDAFDMDETDRFLSVLPIHHAFESTGGLLSPMAAGASVTIARSLKSRELLEDLRDVRPTVFLLVPLFLEKFHQGIERDLRKTSSSNKALFRLLKAGAKICNPFTSGAASKKFFRPIRSAMGLDKLRILVSGGAPLPRPLSRAYELFGFPVCQGYGLSETAPVLSVNVPGRCRNESVGIPLSGIEVKILDPDPEGVGEIAVKGPNIMKGYYLNERATQEAFFEGWFLTGDLGKIDQAGYLYVTGRKKSLIVTRGGKKIRPEEIEEELLKSPFVKETIVIGRSHPRTKTEEIHAIIHPDFEALDRYGKEKGITLTNRAIQELLGQHVDKVNAVLAEYKKVRHFSIREEEFPKTTTNKIRRYLFTASSTSVSPSG